MSDSDCAKCLERQARAELELTWIGRRRRCARRSVEQIYVENIVLVDQVEDIRGDLQRHLVREGESLGDAHVGEHGVGLDPGIARQVAVEVAAVDTGGRGSIAIAGQIEVSGRRIARGDGRIPAARRPTVGGHGVGAIG